MDNRKSASCMCFESMEVDSFLDLLLLVMEEGREAVGLCRVFMHVACRGEITLTLQRCHMLKLSNEIKEAYARPTGKRTWYWEAIDANETGGWVYESISVSIH